MYLINTTTLKLEYFADDTQVEYAILSHRWEKDEVTYKDITAGRSDLGSLAGYYKIWKCCQTARKQDLDYAWVDTCCIDKSSSAELQEAINSMFRWYANAAICYVYLSDVDDKVEISNSKWFTRGWTLQELIAPKVIDFFNYKWDLMGGKESLASIVTNVTRIPTSLLLLHEGDSLSNYSTAEKMSWAQGRVTTRTEDRAYSLLGIFGVNMPMLYGEGDKAFFRLQEEILRKSSDQTLLAWRGVRDDCFNLLATSPDQFLLAKGPNVLEYPHPLRFSRRGAHSITNEGLTLDLEMIPWTADVYLALLNHRGRLPPSTGVIEDSIRQEQNYGIFIRRVDNEDRFIRVKDKEYGDLYGDRKVSRHSWISKNWVEIRRSSRIMRVTIVQNLMVDEIEKLKLVDKNVSGFTLDTDQDWTITIYGQRLYNPEEGRFGVVEPWTGQYGITMGLHLHAGMIESIMLGADFKSHPVICVRPRRARRSTVLAELDYKTDYLRCKKFIQRWDLDGDRELRNGYTWFTGPSQFALIPSSNPLLSTPLPDIEQSRCWIFVFGPVYGNSGRHCINLYLSNPEYHPGPDELIRELIHLQLTLDRKEEASPWLFDIKERQIARLANMTYPSFSWSLGP